MADNNTSIKLYGALAEFPDTPGLYHACEKVRDAGFFRWDAHSPFPVHGLDRAMGLKPTMLPWLVFALAMVGASSGMLMQWWMNAVDYPIIIAAKPMFSWQAFVPVTFELSILFSAIGCILGILHFCRLPRLHHPLFSSQRFERVTDDAFFISIEAADPKFDADATVAFLKEIGATNVELIED